MTIILFLIDTSGSMNQRTHYGARPTLLDVTKETVEKFIKIRQRDVASRGDRYMLLTFDEVPFNVKAGWKENHSVFMNELKNLNATGMTTFGSALKNAFDYLNINRMQTGIDTYVQGRCPYYLEPAIIIAITDGARYSTSTNVQHELNLPMNTNCPGSEFTLEPFRWDQRLFSIVLRLTGTYNCDPPSNGSINGCIVPCDDSPINAMCEVTGGRSFCVSSQKALTTSLEQLISRMHIGVMIKFEKCGPDPPLIANEDENGDGSRGNLSYDSNNRLWLNTRNLIYVRSGQKGYSVGHWPIPESYWPDSSIQPRTAHPIVKFTCTNSEPTVIDNLPFDKYELDPSALTQFILSRKQPNVAWQVYVANSQGNSELGQPFGYLKASTSLTCVNLFVLPYNYPTLLPLLDEYFKMHQGKPTLEWRLQFEAYLKSMPIYYIIPLRRALQRMGASINLMPDNLDNGVSATLNGIIKKHKNLAKVEFEKLTSSVGAQKTMNIEWPRVSANHSINSLYNRKLTSELYCTNPCLKKIFTGLQNEYQDFNGFIVRYKDKLDSEYKTFCYRNPFDISRHELLDQGYKLRRNFFQKQISHIKYQDEDLLHSLPVGQMGNYQEYLKKQPSPLREIEAQPTRQHMFGNPFKLDKKNVVMIDEADIDLVGGGNSNRGIKRSNSDSYSLSGSKSKRKPGPLPKDFSYFRPKSPTSNPSSPMYSPSSSPSHTSFSASYIQQNSFHLSLPNSKPIQSSSVNNTKPFNKYISPTVIQSNSLNTSPLDTNEALQPNKHHFVANSLQDISLNKSSHSSIHANNIKPQVLTNGKSSIAKPTKPYAIQPVEDSTNNLAFDPCRRINLSNEDKEKVRKVMRLVHSVHDKDHKELIQYLSSFKSSFGEFLLHEAVFDAHRFMKKSLISSLSSYFGPKVQRILQFYQGKNGHARSTNCKD